MFFKDKVRNLVDGSLLLHSNISTENADLKKNSPQVIVKRIKTVHVVSFIQVTFVADNTYHACGDTSFNLLISANKSIEKQS